MTTHKELVRKLAEEMAKVKQPTAYENRTLDRFSDLWENTVDFFTEPVEKIVIEFGAKMFGEGWKEGYHYGIDREGNYCKTCTEAAKERGLIAGKEGEDG